jgi:phospholipase C
VPGLRSAIMTASAMSATRVPGSRPDPTRPAGTATAAMPFNHVVCVMMENHSFDNLLGAPPRLGQPKADCLTFDIAGQATNSNPSSNGTVTAYELLNTEQPGSVDQSWNATHQQIDGGKMDGFVTSVNSTQPMGYRTDEGLPFAYSLARTFCSANRWFCSAPCQTYPNRRFLMAGTAYGNISSDTQSLRDPPPPNGTIFDRLHAYGVSWNNYFTDLPLIGIIPSIIEKYPANLAAIAKLLADCAAGTLPSVSFVDPEFEAILKSPAWSHDPDLHRADTSACCGEQPGPGGPLPGITGPGGGLVGAVPLSPFIAPGTVSATPYSHYSSLASWETLLGLPRLADAARVPATFGSDVFTGARR